MDKISVIILVKNEEEIIIMVSDQRLTGKIQFTPDQVDSLTAGKVFANYPWREEFNIDITSFEESVKIKLNYLDKEGWDR